MKATFLGTNGWYDTATGSTPCVFIETAERFFVFDAGFGFQKFRHVETSGKKIFLFISHLHLDHIIGLHTLPLFRFPQGIDICLPGGMEKILKNLLKHPFTAAPLMLQTRIRFRTIDNKTRLPFRLEMKKLRHPVPCYGYRLEDDGKSFAYCTDTGECANLRRLAANTDLFITECALAPGDKSPKLFHITPESAASVALSSGARKLALCHFDPVKYPSFAERGQAAAAAKKIFQDTVAAIDGAVVEF